VQVRTTRFGTIRVDARDIIRFPEGLAGFEDCQQWIVLAQHAKSSPLWLQSVTRGEVALPLVAPSRFVPQYRVRIDAAELQLLDIERDRDIEVLVVLNHRDGMQSINLKAPLVINMTSRLGRQVVASGSWSTRHLIVASSGDLRQSA